MGHLKNVTEHIYDIKDGKRVYRKSYRLKEALSQYEKATGLTGAELEKITEPELAKMLEKNQLLGGLMAIHSYATPRRYEVDLNMFNVGEQERALLWQTKHQRGGAGVREKRIKSIISSNKALNKIVGHHPGRMQKRTEAAIDSDFSAGDSVLPGAVVKHADKLFTTLFRNRVAKTIINSGFMEKGLIAQRKVFGIHRVSSKAVERVATAYWRENIAPKNLAGFREGIKKSFQTGIDKGYLGGPGAREPFPGAGKWLYRKIVGIDSKKLRLAQEHSKARKAYFKGLRSRKRINLRNFRTQVGATFIPLGARDPMKPLFSKVNYRKELLDRGAMVKGKINVQSLSMHIGDDPLLKDALEGTTISEKKAISKAVFSMTYAHEGAEQIAYNLAVGMAKVGLGPKSLYHIGTHVSRSVLETEAYLLGQLDNPVLTKQHLTMRSAERRRVIDYPGNYVERPADFSKNKVYSEYITKFREGRAGDPFELKETLDQPMKLLTQAVSNKSAETKALAIINKKTAGITMVLDSNKINHNISDVKTKTKNLFNFDRR